MEWKTFMESILNFNQVNGLINDIPFIIKEPYYTLQDADLKTGMYMVCIIKKYKSVEVTEMLYKVIGIMQT